jgi:hypothetical protein
VVAWSASQPAGGYPTQLRRSFRSLFLSDLRWDRITFLLFFSFPRAALSPPSSENVPRSHGTTTTPSWKSREVGLLGS